MVNAMADDDRRDAIDHLRDELRSLRDEHAREIADLWRAQAKLQETLADLHRQAIADRERTAEGALPLRRAN